MECLIDYRGKTPPKADSGIRLITAKVIKDGAILDHQPEFISEETYTNWMRRGFPQRGDILITTEAPLGEVAQLRTIERIALAQRVILLRADPRKVDPQYLFHFLRSPIAQQRLRQRASGTTVSGIRQPELCAVEIAIPPRAHQRRIGAILDALDSLIENNRRRIVLLEQMVQALYQEWFVHFRYPGYEDDDLVESPLGSIPRGWRVASLGDVATLVRRNVHPTRFADADFEHFSIPNFDDTGLPRWESGASIRSGKYLVADSAVLVSKLNPRIPRVWLAKPSSETRSVASTEFLVLQPRTPWSLELLYLLATSPSFRDSIVSLSGGTSTSHQRAKPTDFMQLPVVDPPSHLLSLAQGRVAPIIGLGRALRLQCADLATLRNLLLPKLVTGAIDVSQLDLNAFDDPTAT